MSISSASELESSSLINFARSLHFTDRERIKEREDGKRSCRGGGIIRGRRLFKYFRQRDGYYSRKWGKAVFSFFRPIVFFHHLMCYSTTFLLILFCCCFLDLLFCLFIFFPGFETLYYYWLWLYCYPPRIKFWKLWVTVNHLQG